MPGDEPLVVELWLPATEVIVFFMSFIAFYLIGRMLWRIVPVVGG